MPRNTSVTLGDHFDQFVAEILQQGSFQSVSEIVRAGLRKLEADEAKLQVLRARLQAGEDSPAIEDFDGEQFIARMHKNHPPSQLIPSSMCSNARSQPVKPACSTTVSRRFCQAPWRSESTVFSYPTDSLPKAIVSVFQ